jgi:hypothetical protein
VTSHKKSPDTRELASGLLGGEISLIIQFDGLNIA